MVLLKGIAASSGIGIGNAFLLSPPKLPLAQRAPSDLVAELRRFERAADIFSTRVASLAEQAARLFGDSMAGILTAQIMIVGDPSLQEEVTERVRSLGENIELALSNVLDSYAAHFHALDDDLLRARAADFRDIKTHMLHILAGEGFEPLPELPEGCVLVVEELCPSSAALLPVGKISAIIGVRGTPLSHAAIMARAAKIPAVVSTGGQLLASIRNGDALIVDGSAGEVIHRPTPEEIIRYQQRGHHYSLIRDRLENRPAKTVTRDGTALELGAAITSRNEVPELVEQGAEGVLLSYEHMPESDEHRSFLAYQIVVRALKGRPVTVITGGMNDGQVPGSLPPDMTPASTLMSTTLSSLLRVSALGSVRVAVPVTTLHDLREVRALLESCKGSLMRRGFDFDPNIQLGVAIQTPASALSSQSLAREADFFVLCTDPLVEHILASESVRLHSPFESFHPAVLDLLCETIHTARDAYIPVYLSGDAAADPMMLPFLIGCGADGLMAPLSRLSRLQDQIVNLRRDFWQERIPAILTLPTAEEVVAYLKKNWSERTEQS